MAKAEQLTPAQLIEETCRLVAESSAIQRARAACFTEGALLAVEQVQDVRITNMEVPEQESGWTMWTELAMTFLIDSNVVTKVLKAVARTVYTSLIRSNAVWLLAPNALTGRQLATIAKRQPLRGQLIEPLRDRLLARNVLDDGAGKLPDLATKDSLRLYHSVIGELAHHASGLDLTKATVKTVREVAKRAGRSAPSAANGLPPSYLSVGVEMLSSAQDYTRATILGIDVRAARFEALLRTQASAEDIALICEAMEQPDMRAAAADPNVSLIKLRTQCAIVFEALIWARLFGFRLDHHWNIEGRGYPAWSPVRKGYASLDFDRRALLNYWLDRFGHIIDEWVADGRRASFYSVGLEVRLLYVRGYFAAIAYDFESAAGELAHLVGSTSPNRRP